MARKGASKKRYHVVAGEAPAPAPADCAPVAAPKTVPATFALLYESKDGRLCTFEDKEGHLTSVDASKLV